jgi:DNA-binding transcriptional LysR family regulator
MFLIGEDLRAGRLERVLTDWSLPDTDILAVFPSRRRPSARVRAMVGFLARCFATRRAGSIGRS